MRIFNIQFRFWLLVFLIISALPFFCACNDDVAGKTIISNIKGEVLVKKAGSGAWINGEIKMILGKGDAIKSGTGADAVITFFEGSTIELKADTRVEITELVKKQGKIIRLKQEIGETISIVEKLVDAASRYEIETPAAVAGVRGSSMQVSVAPDGATVVQNLEGQISVVAQGIEVKIPEEGVGTVKPGEPPLLELSYDDGSSEGGYSLGGPQNLGFLVRFEPPSPSFKVSRIRILSWIKGIPGESDNFTVRITDKDLAPLWEKSLPLTWFTANPSWLDVEVPDVAVNGSFCVQLHAPTLGQGLGPYIGNDQSSINEHSELLSGWKIIAWTLSIPQERTNWMIRVDGK